MRRSFRNWTFAAAFGCASLLAGCSGGVPEGGGGNVPDVSTAVFPRNLAVASPLGRGGLELNLAAIDGQQFSDVSNYDAFASAIAAILDGSVTPEDGFAPKAFLRRGIDAECYGPRIWYTDHPDLPTTTPSANDGELPTGDVGMWFATEGDSPEACAAAQLNARMAGIEGSVFGALTGLAAMAVVANGTTSGLPTAGSFIDLSSELGALSFADTTVLEAVLEHDVGGAWSYFLQFEVTDGPTVTEVIVQLDHEELATGFQGILHYRSSDASGSFFGNCDPSLSGTSPNGSVAYKVDGSAIQVQARSATYCGLGVDGRNGGEVLDPDFVKSLSEPNGWGNNFDVFTANFATSGLAGSYAYSWQAGPNDAATRNLNVVVSEDESSGSAFFGFGAEIADLDANITQMHCLWAVQEGWGFPRPSAASMQRQDFSLGSAVYEPVTSNITYAPTRTCDYDGTSGFGYSALSQPASETPAGAVSNDLVAIVDLDVNGTPDAIDATDFVMPSAPSF